MVLGCCYVLSIRIRVVKSLVDHRERIVPKARVGNNHQTDPESTQWARDWLFGVRGCGVNVVAQLYHI